MECSCNVLWLRAWYQETNSHPGPRCRDGNLLTDMRVSKSECDSSNDSRMNQVLLMNEHGDIFKRQISMDECDSEQYNESENIPSSPVESEYFYEQFIDYPLNDSAAEQSSDLRQPNTSLSPFSRNITIIRNDTILNYDQHKLQQLHSKNTGGSTFTFFGMPLPSLSNLWGGGAGGGTTRKSNSRADVDANGKSRLRNFRPRPGEIVESFQFSNNVHLPTNVHLPPQAKPIPPTIITNKEPTNIHPPPPPPNSPFAPPNSYFTNIYAGPQVEKGGFIPMLPGRKGFTPIQNPYANETDNSDVQETVSTELRPNVDLEFDDTLDDVPDNKYPFLVPTVSADPNRPQQHIPQSQFNVSSLKKGEITAPTKSSNGISLIRSSTPSVTLTTKGSTAASSTTTPRISAVSSTPQNIPTVDRNGVEIDYAKRNIQKIIGKTARPPIVPTSQKPDVNSATTPFFPTFMPNSSDTINLSKNRPSINGSAAANGVTSGSALSALVAPGAQQGIPRPVPGRSIITKVFNSTSVSSSFAPTSIPLHSTSSMKPSTVSSTSSTTSTTTKLPVAHKLPTAEEYLRTTSQDNSIKDSTTPNSQLNKAINTNDLDDQATQYKGDMNWYYSNYNRSTWKEPQLDSSLYRFRTHSGTGCLNTSHFTIIIFTLILATKFLD